MPLRPEDPKLTAFDVPVLPLGVSPVRLHNRKTFFKYMPVQSAALVLLNRTLRWSSPILFNDPFDVPREIVFGVKPEEIMEAAGRQMARMIDDPPEDASNLSPELRLIVETVKKGIPADVKAEMLKGLETRQGDLRPSGEPLEEFRGIWRRLLPDFRILCFTESPLHAAMWLHYSDRYRGAVLEFFCDEELDSPWLAAKPVAYTETIPAVYTAEGWAALLALDQRIAVERMFELATYTKSPDWSYEREWRVASFKREEDTGDFTDYKFNATELVGVYLGPSMPEADRSALLRLSKAYPSAKAYEVSIGSARQFLLKGIG